MPERYVDAIIKYLADRDYQPLKPRQLARQMGVAEEEYSAFREAVKVLRDSGRLVLGAKNALVLPEMGRIVTGTFRANRRGFGFVVPNTPNAHGDLFIPEGATGGALTGDEVAAEVIRRGGSRGQAYEGRIKEIVRRGASRVVGTLQQTDGTWFVLPDGTAITVPVVIADVGPGATAGQKVVTEIIHYPAKGEFARGVILENLGAAGGIAAETLAVIRAHGLPDAFSEEALAEARQAAGGFDPQKLDGREDLTGKVIVTIDPVDARDFDDAISIERLSDGWLLGVHIADVSHFVREGGVLDTEARARGNSVYFPRQVVPMLPELLSNGVCSLQEGQKRFCKTAFIRYDKDANVVGVRLAETVIQSRQRLNYQEAQAIIDGNTGGCAPEVVELLANMNQLARLIEQRRRSAGMIHLDLPAVELVLDEHGHVTDAVPEDASYTHTIIEMFMVEGNEAVAGALDSRNIPLLRRVHPSPDNAAGAQLANFIRVCGFKIPREMSRHDIQRLLGSVKGRPQSHAVNLAVLKSFESAEYSPMKIGHYALASENYCHFTSPIRRYPDLTVHRLFADVARGRQPESDLSALVGLGNHCSTTERRAQAAEGELRSVLVLQLLAKHVGDEVPGVIDGVTNFGMFVQLDRFLVDGLIRMENLGDDWWEVRPQAGEIRGQRTGKRYRIGDPMQVRIASVNIPARQLNLAPVAGAPKKDNPPKAGKRRKK